MEAINILAKTTDLDWDYDSEVDVLYLSSGLPTPAITLDIGNGLLARYSPETQNLVGLTIYGLKDKLLHFIHQNLAPLIEANADQLQDGMGSQAHVYSKNEVEFLLANPGQAIEDFRKSQELIEGSVLNLEITRNNLTNANNEYINLRLTLPSLKSDINAVIKINEELINELDRQIEFSNHSLGLIQKYLAGEPPEFPAIDEE